LSWLSPPNHAIAGEPAPANLYPGEETLSLERFLGSVSSCGLMPGRAGALSRAVYTQKRNGFL